MNQDLPHPDIQKLRTFLPFQELRQDQLTLLSRHLQVETAPSGTLLIERGSTENYFFFLSEGRVRLEAEDGKTLEVQSGSDQARRPIAQLVPRKFKVTSITPINFLRIPPDLIPRNHPESKMERLLFGYEVLEGSSWARESDSEHQLTYQLYQDLKNDRLVLPSLPEVAIRVGQAIEDQSSNAKRIAGIIQNDPAITAKIVKAANSAFYGSSNPVHSCNDAVVRLGMRVTHNLVLAYTMRDLFQPRSRLLQQRMEELWHHSTHVAALCYVLAKQSKLFNPDEAMLIGLLHDIGVAAIINQAANYPALASSPNALDHATTHLRSPIGGAIMVTWHFPEEFVQTALEAEEWLRNGREEPDYCDLLIVAQLHSFVGSDRALTVPPLNEVPALTRLGLSELTPKQSLKILEAAADQIESTELLLKA